MPRFFLLFIITMLVFSSCGREQLESYNSNFTGTWHNRDTVRNAQGLVVTYYMRVEGESSEIKMGCDQNGICWMQAEGKIVINRKHQKLIVTEKDKMSFFRMRLDINELPHQDASGQWLCTIETIVMVRD